MSLGGRKHAPDKKYRIPFSESLGEKNAPVPLVMGDIKIELEGANKHPVESRQ